MSPFMLHPEREMGIVASSSRFRFHVHLDRKLRKDVLRLGPSLPAWLPVVRGDPVTGRARRDRLVPHPRKSTISKACSPLLSHLRVEGDSPCLHERAYYFRHYGLQGHAIP